MKFCPYCGADLLKEDAAFCVECGKQLSSAEQASLADAPATPEEQKPAKKKAKQKKEKPPKKKKEKKKKSKEPIPEIVGEPVDDGYDGYYNDVLPPDLDREKEGLDKELIKKIVALCVAVIFIIGLCVVMMYVL